MVQVTEDALDFALTHVIAKGDTDVLPPAFEFRAIFEQWDEIRSYLASQDLDLWTVRPARRCLAPKRSLGFRIATQLDPLDTLLITALVYEVGADLEQCRVPVGDEVVHSYRFSPLVSGQLYRPDYNFDSFRRRSLDLAEDRDGLVLMTDIADFFPRLYSHSLENALDASTSNSDHVRVIAKFIAGWNQRVSHGIPVGPAIFRLLAEVTIDDVDRSLLSEGYSFCRFSDDYRIFVADERKAREACAFLANTLLRHHGLTIQESKTEIVPAEVFLTRYRRTEEDEERLALQESFDGLVKELHDREEQAYYESLDDDDPWTTFTGLDQYAEINYEDLTDEQKAIVDSLNLWQILRAQLEADGALDIPLTRFVLRRIAQLRLHDEDGLLLSNVARLYPVFPQVVEAIAVQGDGNPTERHRTGGRLLELFDDSIVGHLEYHRNWILSVFSEDASWNNADRLIQLYGQYPDQLSRPETTAAIGAAKQAHWFRSRKQEVTSLPPWERRAFLAGARCLPRDEAKHWYRSIASQLDPLEKAVAHWAQQQA